MGFISQLFNLDNKVVVITGGSGILGFEMAKGLLEAGAKVVLLGTNKEKIKNRIDSLEFKDDKLIGLKCNVLDEENIRDVNDAILNKFNRIDILINAAGGNVPGATVGLDQSIFDVDISQFKKVVDLNLNGTVLSTLIFAKSMSVQKSGSIINISSMAAQRAITRVMGYSAAKAAIENFTKWLALELAQKFGDGIRVNAIAPGFIITEQNRTLLTNQDGTFTERGKTVINITPFKRFGLPEELIGTVLWLAGDASKFVTGAVIPVDGGFSIFSGV
jgi:NAD(P)-dependent dehydrogenase (short-subunit alcohol dehydrogenase family)